MGSYIAVKVYGHVIAYNYVANFHDGIDGALPALPVLKRGKSFEMEFPLGPGVLPDAGLILH